MTKKKFRFGAGVFSTLNREELIATARANEARGYDVVLMPDHYVQMLHPMVALQCVADATERVRLGTFVIANDYRHPAELAKMFSTLDVLSGGRAEPGIGTGYAEPEYKAIGLKYDEASVRVTRLTEGIQVLKKLLAGEKVTFEGSHYQLADFENHPKCVQQPRPPLLVGGGGKRMLSMAAREADIIGLAPTSAGFPSTIASCTWANTVKKISWIKEAAGNRFDEIELNSYNPLAPAMITDDPRKAVRDILDRARQRLPENQLMTDDEFLESPHVFIGTEDSLVEKFQRMRDELGISYFMMFDGKPLEKVVARLQGT